MISVTYLPKILYIHQELWAVEWAQEDVNRQILKHTQTDRFSDHNIRPQFHSGLIKMVSGRLLFITCELSKKGTKIGILLNKVILKFILLLTSSLYCFLILLENVEYLKDLSTILICNLKHVLFLPKKCWNKNKKTKV